MRCSKQAIDTHLRPRRENLVRQEVALDDLPKSMHLIEKLNRVTELQASVSARDDVAFAVSVLEIHRPAR
jgi:hypothetical protein